MKYQKFVKFTVLALCGLFLASCNDDDNGNNNGGARGPADSAAFAGSTISFNPTISFLANGEISYFNEEDGSNFVLAEESAPLGGSYSYLPSSSFLAGDLIISIDGETTETVTLTNFVTQNGNVISFDMTFTSGSKFNALVTGVIKAAKVAPSALNNNLPENFSFSADGNLEAGTTFSRNFLFGGGTGDLSNSPLENYSDGESVDFSIGADGSLNFDGISLPFLGVIDGILFWSDNETTADFDPNNTVEEEDLLVAYTNGNGANPGTATQAFGR